VTPTPKGPVVSGPKGTGAAEGKAQTGGSGPGGKGSSSISEMASEFPLGSGEATGGGGGGRWAEGLPSQAH